MSDSICFLPAHELAALVRRRELSAEACTQAFLDRIGEVEGRLSAFITIAGDQALAEARSRDRDLAGADLDRMPLYGIPIAVKDNIVTKDVETTCGSRILKGFIPPYDATCVARLKQAGAVIIGKTNCDEFGMGSSTENSAFKTTRNPWDTRRVPGGSSGGSAAAVAAGEAALSLGTDTGGSVRQPASFCGVVGLKPTYGRVSRYGLVAFASSLDQVGAIARDTVDCALLASVISGHDVMDSTSVAREVDSLAGGMEADVGGLTIGLPKEFFGSGIDDDVRYAVEMAICFYERRGFKVKSISLPHTPYGIACYYILADAEASSNLARYDGVRYGYRSQAAETIESLYAASRGEGFGPEVKRRIMLGTYALSAGYYDEYYLKALKVRARIAGDFAKAFDEVDVVIAPTAPTPAFLVGEKLDDPLKMYLSDVFTITPSLAGLPALSLPCGFSNGGLLIGMQLVGKPFDEARLLKVARLFEQETAWHKAIPEIGDDSDGSRS
ncbi:MAG: Asp-tRNA(Asn)/Glu-tRNA(Gln) amidotransferase subunit GatA [Candidatus Eisenbacteria bacterium]